MEACRSYVAWTSWTCKAEVFFSEETQGIGWADAALLSDTQDSICSRNTPWGRCQTWTRKHPRPVRMRKGGVAFKGCLQRLRNKPSPTNPQCACKHHLRNPHHEQAPPSAPLMITQSQLSCGAQANGRACSAGWVAATQHVFWHSPWP